MRAAIGVLTGAALALGGCGMMPSGAGWTTLLDGKSLQGWNRLGDANWRIADGAAVADAGGKTPSYLVSKDSYDDFELRVEFWMDEQGSSGVFFRCADAVKVGAATCYEAQIADTRTDGYSTGALTNLVKVSSPHKAAGRWNEYVVRATGPDISVTLNGVETAKLRHEQYKRGPIALQWLGGTMKFRKVDIRPL